MPVLQLRRSGSQVRAPTQTPLVLPPLYASQPANGALQAGYAPYAPYPAEPAPVEAAQQVPPPAATCDLLVAVVGWSC